MKKITVICIILILLTATGCAHKNVSKHHYIFIGENECWTIGYEVYTTVTTTTKQDTIYSENKTDNTLRATYKKDLSELASKKTIKISYETSTGGVLITEEDVIEVTINIDGNIQTIELIN